MTDTGTDPGLRPTPRDLRNIVLKIKRPIQLGALLMILIFTYPLIKGNGPLATRFSMETYILLGLLVIAFIIASALKPIDNANTRALVLIVLFLPIILGMGLAGYVVLVPPPPPTKPSLQLYRVAIQDSEGHIAQRLSTMKIHAYWGNQLADEGQIDPESGIITFKVIPASDTFNHRLSLRILAPNYYFQDNDSTVHVLQQDADGISLKVVDKNPPPKRIVDISPNYLWDIFSNCHLDSIGPGAPIRITVSTDRDAFIQDRDNANQATMGRDCHVVILSNGRRIWTSRDVLEDMGTVPQAASAIRNRIAREMSRILLLHLKDICNAIDSVK